MKIDIVDNDVIFHPEERSELYKLVNKLNTQSIPYKSFCGVMIVLSYSQWLKAEL